MQIKMPTGIPLIDKYKKTNRLEVAISLFDVCNLNCEFCFQNDHPIESITPKKIMACLPEVAEKINKRIENEHFESIDIKLWGGEILIDGFQDHILNTYVELIKKLSKLIHDHPITVMFLTNGVHTKYDRIKAMMDELYKLPNVITCQIKLSYDPVGRFRTEKQFNAFMRSATEYYKMGQKYYNGHSIVLTKPTIKEYLEGNHMLFDERFLNTHININFYVPNNEWRKYMPTPDDYFKFFRYCIDNKFFNIDVIESIFMGFIPEFRHYLTRICNCREMLQYSSATGECSGNCIKARIREIPASEFYGEKIAKELTDENQYFTHSYMSFTKNGCFSCEYFDGCPQFCHTSMLYKKYDSVWCPYRKLYGTITEQDVANFKKFLIEDAPHLDDGTKYKEGK